MHFSVALMDKGSQTIRSLWFQTTSRYVYVRTKEFYDALADIEFDSLNLAAELNNEKLDLITRKLSSILDRIYSDFNITEEVDSDE